MPQPKRSSQTLKSDQDVMMSLRSLAESVQRLLVAVEDEPMEEQLAFIIRNKNQMAKYQELIRETEDAVHQWQHCPDRLIAAFTASHSVFQIDELERCWAPQASGEKSRGQTITEELLISIQETLP